MGPRSFGRLVFAIAIVASASAGASGMRVTLTGIRLTRGDAVHCPQIRDDAGAIHAVSYLSPGIALGDRVTVRGVYAVTPTCLGRVLVVEDDSVP